MAVRLEDLVSTPSISCNKISLALRKMPCQHLGNTLYALRHPRKLEDCLLLILAIADFTGEVQMRAIQGVNGIKLIIDRTVR